MKKIIVISILLSLCVSTANSQTYNGNDALKAHPQVSLYISTDSLYSILGFPDYVDSNRLYMIRMLERQDTLMPNTIYNVNYLYYLKKGLCFIEKNNIVKLYEINFKFQPTTNIVVSDYSLRFGIRMKEICKILSFDETSCLASKSYIVGESTPLKCYCLSFLSQGKYPNDNILLFFNKKKKLIAMTIPYW